MKWWQQLHKNWQYQIKNFLLSIPTDNNGDFHLFVNEKQQFILYVCVIKQQQQQKNERYRHKPTRVHTVIKNIQQNVWIHAHEYKEYNLFTPFICFKWIARDYKIYSRFHIVFPLLHPTSSYQFFLSLLRSLLLLVVFSVLLKEWVGYKRDYTNTIEKRR